MAFATEIKQAGIDDEDPEKALGLFLVKYKHPAATGFARNWIATQTGGYGGDRGNFIDALKDAFPDLDSNEIDELVDHCESWRKRWKRKMRLRA